MRASISKTRFKSWAQVALVLAWAGRRAFAARIRDGSLRGGRGSAGTIQSRHSAAGAKAGIVLGVSPTIVLAVAIVRWLM